MKSKGARVLVIDSSRAYAGMVKDMLSKHVPSAEVDVATNIYELKRRLSKGTYNLVIADLSVAYDGDDMASELEKTDAFVVVWSALQSRKGQNCEIRKPLTLDEISKVVPSLGSTAKCWP